MEKYYVHGCRSNGDEIERCEDSEAQFWTLYARDSEGLSQGVIDCVFREDAVAAMAVYVERDRLNEQVQAVKNALELNEHHCDTDCVMDELGISYADAELRANGARAFRDGIAKFATAIHAAEVPDA
ncbi:hypothetical protein [Pantoea coffeiphila]|uniref:Uncharacterized protein n=1 Tax=Pantoea coffeiphila TaxID=1465635 RepID=A0A2S9I5Q5_9GAMM|nr:hypothetical protein [Pantoea coffeiphila]PRD13126.1 hypothetical protein CQW29_22910 [Pantoea coffeiphila]